MSSLVQVGLVGAAVLTLGVGCKPKEETVSPTVTLEVALRGNAESNGGRPLQVVVRRTDAVSFFEDRYAAIEALVTKPDDSVLGVFVVFPGAVAYGEIEVEAGEPAIGVYGLFANPEGEDWKVLVEGAGVVDLVVDQGRLLDDEGLTEMFGG